MIINPDKAVEMGAIRNIEDDWKQPNAIDFTVDHLYDMAVSDKSFILYKDGKEHRDRTELKPIDGFWHLE